MKELQSGGKNDQGKQGPGLYVKFIKGPPEVVCQSGC